MTPEELDVEFPLGPDSLPQSGVPHGKLEKFTWATSRIFPGTVRDCWIYVPTQYDPAQPACLLVVQDGEAHWSAERRWRIPTILDNLIHQQAIPVMIGVFVDPGVIPATVPGAYPRVNRSFEYDSLGDRYVRFLLEEILPEVGRRYRLAPDGNSRAIMGGSSGGVCAFNAAWERPDAFARVLSIVGSYTAMRGGHAWPALVRQTEPKPLRVFLQSGGDDFKIYAGDWWVANQDLLAALTYAGYEVNHAWAEHAGHNDFHGSMIFPDALRWLWHGYPAPIAAGVKSQQPVRRVLIPDEDWQMVDGEFPSASALAANASGEVVFASGADDAIYRLDSDGRPKQWAQKLAGVTDLAFGPAGTLFACQPEKRRILKIAADGKNSVWMKDLDAGGICFAANGGSYVTEPKSHRVWHIARGGERRVVGDGIASPRAVRMFADQSQLIVTDEHGQAAWLFTIQLDGTLTDKAPFFRLNLVDGETDSGAVAVAVSPKGWAVFATHAGLQLAMPSGLVMALVPAPRNAGQLAGVAFGGADLTRLYVTCGGKLYMRPIRHAESLWC